MVLLLALRAPCGAAEQWVDDRFEDFAQGKLDAGGQNLYVSREGAIRTINRFDLNRDGHLDLIFNCTHDTYQMVPATAGAVTAEGDLQIRPIAVEGSQRVVLADLDRDGFTDAVFCPNRIGVHHDRRHLSIAWGGADGWSPQRINGALPMNGAVAVAVVDLNRDGFLDIATLGASRWRVEQPPGRIIRLFWGSANGFSAIERQDIGVTAAVELTAADIDGDAVDDLGVLGSDGRLTVVWATAGATPIAFSRTVIPLPPIQALCVTGADLDGDARAELVIGTDRPEVCLVEVDREAANSRAQIVPAWSASQVSVGDLDADGHVDLVLTRFSGARAAGGEQAGADDQSVDRVRIMWGGERAFDRQRSSSLRVPYAVATAMGDLNADGRLDLAVAVHQSIDRFSGQSVVYLGSGERVLSRQPGGFATSGTTDVGIADAAGDLPARAVFCNSIGGLVDEGVPLLVYWGGRDGFAAERVWKIPFHSGYEASAADLNADGFVDLIVLNSGHAGDAAHSDPTLGANILWGGPDGFDLVGRRTVLHEHFLGTSGVADLNRDGYLDLVLEPFAAEPGQVDMLFIYYGGADGFDRERRVAFPSEGYSQEHLIADLNGDEWLDLAVTSRSLHCTRIFWNGPQGFDPQREQRLKMPGALGVDAADFNRDGYLDILVGSYDDPLAGYRDMGNVIFWGGQRGFRASNAQWLPGFSPLGRPVAALDGYGPPDIFSPQHSGEPTREDLACHIYWGSETGFATRRRTTLFSDSVNDSMVGDFNSDGKLDLAVNAHTRHGDHRTRSRVFYNDGRRFQNPKVERLPTNGPHLMWAADVGHIADRKYRQRYESRVFHWDKAAALGGLTWDAQMPPQTALEFEIRAAGDRDSLTRGAWRPLRQGRFSVAPGDRTLQYRALLRSDNGDRFPVLTRGTVRLE